MRSKKEAWKEFSEEIQSTYFKGGLLKNDKIESTFQNWKITIDTYDFTMVTPTVIIIVYSRIRAPFIPTSDFTFRISKKTIFNKVSEKLGNSYIATGDLSFDNDFVVNSDSENIIKTILNEKVRKLMLDNSGIKFEISNDKTVIGKQFPNSGLSLIVEGEIKDKHKLISLYNLFGEILISLLENGLIEDSSVDVKLK